jgi:F0F1-type ATP synthase delta subunit
MTNLEILKSVPPDMHQLIVDPEPVTEERKKILRQLIKQHGTEYVHRNMTPLYLAVSNGREEYMNILLEAHANILYEQNGQNLKATDRKFFSIIQ